MLRACTALLPLCAAVFVAPRDGAPFSMQPGTSSQTAAAPGAAPHTAAPLTASSQAALPPAAAALSAASTAPAYLDPGRPLDARIADLIFRMTLDEKISQLMNESAAIPRLAVPAYDWWNEALHGVARAGRATVFPQAIGLAATFDDDLLQRIAGAIGDEARAKHNAAVRLGRRRRYGGLTFWTPNVNIFRDPRWGRGQETYGEDPYLTGRMGAAFVRGLQGVDPRYLKAAACAKHFAVHSGPEATRHGFNAFVSRQDMNETYLPAFKTLVDAHVEAVMCAYNRLDGEPCCGNATLLGRMLRDEWDFQGHVVTDCGAPYDFHMGHCVTPDAVASAALAINSGVNLNCGSEFKELRTAVERGMVSEDTIHMALMPLLRTRFRLGLFDPPADVPFSRIGPETIRCERHRLLAREAAGKSIVLLKNRGNVLPLSKDIASLYVTGPNAATIEPLLGNYHGLSADFVTILEGLVGGINPGGYVGYGQGCLLDRPNRDSSDGAIWNAHEADAVVAVMGLNGLLEGEEGDALASDHGGDRADIGLPANQLDFLRRLRADYHKPLIVVLTGGGPLAIPEVHELADAILFAWYPGEQGGAAVAEVIFGDVSPSGRLPVTFPKSTAQLPPFDDYAMRGRTYRYLREEPLYPFGFGLSYTTFRYGRPTLDRDVIHRGESTSVEITVENTGLRAAEEVVQLYVTALDGPPNAPIASLKGFQRIAVEPGKRKVLRFAITPSMLTCVNAAGAPQLEAGRYRIVIGGASPGERSVALGAADGRTVMLRAEWGA